MNEQINELVNIAALTLWVRQALSSSRLSNWGVFRKENSSTNMHAVSHRQVFSVMPQGYVMDEQAHECRSG